jgi:hypothetical protein
MDRGAMGSRSEGELGRPSRAFLHGGVVNPAPTGHEPSAHTETVAARGMRRHRGHRPPRAMSRALRRTVVGTFAVLWASGSLWLVLHHLFPQQTAFGPAPNAWEAQLLRLHGWVAVAAVFLLGWLGGGHIIERWARPGQRLSGYVLCGAAAVLVLTGYALYYTTDRVHDGAALAHEVLGAAAILIALTHWRGSHRRTR